MPGSIYLYVIIFSWNLLKSMTEQSAEKSLYINWLIAYQKWLQHFWCFLHLQTLEFVEPFRPYHSFDTLKRFLQYDGKVLRFFCLWDDSSSLFGDRREFVLHYFLSDDTIEIRELLPLNSGRDAMSSFLRRSKLPKVSSLSKYVCGPRNLNHCLQCCVVALW